MRHAVLFLLLAGCVVISDRDGRWMDSTYPVGSFAGAVEGGLFRRGFRQDLTWRVVVRRLTHGPDERSAPVALLRGNPVGETECWSQTDQLIEGGQVRVICFAVVEGRTTWHQAFDLGRLPGGVVQ